MTILFVHVAWVFFRAGSFQQAWAVCSALVGRGAAAGFNLFDSIGGFNRWSSVMVMVAGLICLTLPNSSELAARFRPSWRWLTLVVALLLLSTLYMNSLLPKEFLYFDF